MEKLLEGGGTSIKTIRKVIEENPGATLDLFTSAGYLMVTPEVCASLLRQEPVKMNPGCSGCDMEFPAQMVLGMYALTITPDKDNTKLLHIMADYMDD